MGAGGAEGDPQPAGDAPRRRAEEAERHHRSGRTTRREAWCGWNLYTRFKQLKQFTPVMISINIFYLSARMPKN